MNATGGRFELPGADGLVTFEGELLARGSTHEPFGERSRRWTELSIYRRSDGSYVTHVVGRSTNEGERDRHATQVVADPAAVYAVLVKRDKPRLVESDVISAAASRDSRFAVWLGDRLEVEDLEGCSSDGETHVVARDDDRALRFRGIHIAHGSSRDEDRPGLNQRLWTEIDIYAVAGPRYVVHKTQRELAAVEPRRAVAWVVRTGKAAFKALRRPGSSRLETAALDALAEAADRSEHFEQTLEGLLDENLSQRTAGSLPAIGDAKRDARRPLLELLAGGARILTEPLGARNSRVIGWVGMDSGPQIPYQVFYRLSRDRLIRHARGVGPATPGTTEWEISDLGRAALESSSRLTSGE